MSDITVIQRVISAGFKASGVRRPIRAGNYDVSIQAGVAAYCIPRESGLPLAEYQEVEIALWLADGSRSWATPENTPFLAQWAHLWGDDDVAGYVPWETVQAIVDAAEAEAAS